MQKDLQLYKKTSKAVFKYVKETFPFKSNGEFLNFQNLFGAYFVRLKNIETDREFFIYLEKFLSLLKNSHTKLINYPNKKYFKPKEYNVLLCENRFFIKKNNKIIGEIILVDNQKPRDILEKYLSFLNLTKQYSEQQALRFILISEHETPVTLKIRTNNKLKTLSLKREPICFTPPKKIIESKILEDNVGYLRIMSWKDKDASQKILNRKLKYFLDKNVKSLVIDLRGNEGGNSGIAEHLATHFVDKKVLFSKTKKRLSKDNFSLKTYYSYVEPMKPYFSSPIILLVDARCLSSNEYFIAGLKDNKRAYLIGQTTGGGSGCPKYFKIPFRNSEIEISVSTWRYLRPNNKPLEGKGIRPHLFVRPKYRDLLRGKDAVLEIAIKKSKRLAI